MTVTGTSISRVAFTPDGETAFLPQQHADLQPALYRPRHATARCISIAIDPAALALGISTVRSVVARVSSRPETSLLASTPLDWEYDPLLTPDGHTSPLHPIAPKGQGGHFDINEWVFVESLLQPGIWGPLVNTAVDEYHPRLRGDQTPHCTRHGFFCGWIDGTCLTAPVE